jgi:hypothetical protein
MAFLPGMVQRNHGHVVAISPVAGPCPLSNNASHCSVTGTVLSSGRTDQQLDCPGTHSPHPACVCTQSTVTYNHRPRHKCLVSLSYELCPKGSDDSVLLWAPVFRTLSTILAISESGSVSVIRWRGLPTAAFHLLSLTRLSSGWKKVFWWMDRWWLSRILGDWFVQ